MRRILLPLLVLAAAGCDLTTPTRQLGLSLQAMPVTATVGDSIAFIATAQGTALVGVELAYGDGISQVYNTGGAATAQITFKHAYQSAGTYQVQGTVTDSRGGMKSTTLSVMIQ